MFHKGNAEIAAYRSDAEFSAELKRSVAAAKQALRESKESAHRIAGIILRMATNFQRDFHELLPPEQWPIQRYQKLKPEPTGNP